tara:strand:+ start:244 stop:519 length:276 start_codon:yes stop_codon:yes gene_type:complete
MLDFTSATGREKHGVIVDYDIFRKVVRPTGQDVPLPELDLRLNPNAKAVDAGTILPTITDDFSGKAPDIGAYEVGVELPHYGQRKVTATTK